ncbi:hypothetical protein [Burkholderia multivorans]|uniref:hypothetical protein n=1 Tax=Burkholderia multivorans TaxID=87883 RepID=UPI000A5669DA|nr:hypothetical protein [Burkholderia multivorans]MBU9618520.1 hypothetical protein [Burkholderia multivorans]MCO8578880.1 hypothetical protein [Burkholderia multivorans]NGM75357.1 hypothetical protein [Burkholderia multivorans]
MRAATPPMRIGNIVSVARNVDFALTQINRVSAEAGQNRAASLKPGETAHGLLNRP